MSCIEISCLGFNTTFVTVLLTVHHLVRFATHVSIQLLLLFYNCTDRRENERKLVSIQLLLLFYQHSHFHCLGGTLVSIQLLLLFYLYTGLSAASVRKVSIQLLLLFYHITAKSKKQNISFNTTFVTVLWRLTRIRF